MESPRRLVIAFALYAPLAVKAASAAGEPTRHGVAGPVAADVLHVVDGDTILVVARPWPQQTVEVLVRLRGIDAPELRSRCSETRGRAEAAKELLSRLIAEGQPVLLSNVSGDKYFGRVVADIRLSDNSNPAQDIVAAGLATPYDGGRKPVSDCNR